MKKKIKDLTVIEIANICKKYKSCLDCPLNNEHRICDLPCKVEEEDLEQEIDLSKELSPSEEVLYITKIDERFLGQEVYLLKKDTAERVAKYLKAFEIIKERQVDVGLLLDCETELEYLNRCCNRYWNNEKCGWKRLSQEEFDLLKEILK